MPSQYSVTRLAGGVTVATACLPEMTSVSLGVWAGVGSRHEPAPLAGISHFIEHMLFKGTRRRSPARISQAVEGIGGYLNAFTDEEHTCFYARAHARRLPELVDVLLDMFLNSVFHPVEIRRERSVILEEMAMYQDQPAELVQDLLNTIQFPGHPLGRPVIGSAATLKALRQAHFLDYLRTHYTAGSTMVTAAGNLQHAELVELVGRHTRRFRPGARPDFEPVRHEPAGLVVQALTKPIEQANFCLGIRTCSRHDPRRFALRLLNVLLGENMSSRLFQVVREEHGLTYNIHSAATFWDDCGDLVVSAGLDPGELARTLRLVARELRRLAEAPPSRAEFRRARDYVLGQFDLHLESTESQMMSLGEQLLGYGRLIPPAQLKEHLAAVTPAAVRAAARDFFRPERFSLALVGPRKSTHGLARLLVG